MMQMVGTLTEHAEVHEDYSPPLSLVRTIYKRYAFPGPGKMELNDSAEVPSTTQFVHIAITGVKMCFGSADNDGALTGTLGGLLFEVLVKTPRDQLKSGKVEFYIQTHMAHESSHDPWFGTLAITIMCFGIPETK
jgi:hypothetical protein